MIAASFWWYLARSTGLVAAVLLVLALAWGLFLSTELLKPVSRPAWLLDLHRWLGGLTVAFVGLHLLGLLMDTYVEFTLRSILVPMASEWRPVAVTWGVAGLYLLGAVQLTSWSRIRSRLSRRTWRAIHLLSLPLVWVVAMHSGTAGTDAGNRLYVFSMFALVTLAMWTVLFRILAGTKHTRRVRAAGERRAETAEASRDAAVIPAGSRARRAGPR